MCDNGKAIQRRMRKVWHIKMYECKKSRDRPKVSFRGVNCWSNQATSFQLHLWEYVWKLLLFYSINGTRIGSRPAASAPILCVHATEKSIAANLWRFHTFVQFYLKWIWNIAPLSITSYRALENCFHWSSIRRLLFIIT